MVEILASWLTNKNILLYLGAYLIGAIPFGFIYCKYFYKIDIRESGSGSIGATNVLRILKNKDPKKAKILSISTALSDAFKGIIVLIIAKMLDSSDSVLYAIAVFAVIGHCFSPYLNFEGGKGVATGAGVILFLMPIPAISTIIAWIITGKVLKISSISSLIGLATCIITAQFIPNAINSNTPLYLISFIIVYKHIPNIYRLFTKEESKVI